MSDLTASYGKSLDSIPFCHVWIIVSPPKFHRLCVQLMFTKTYIIFHLENNNFHVPLKIIKKSIIFLAIFKNYTIHFFRLHFIRLCVSINKLSIKYEIHSIAFLCKLLYNNIIINISIIVIKKTILYVV